MGLIGGSNLNGSLAKRGLLNEVILDIEPIVLGSSKRLFGEYEIEFKLELIESRELGGGTVQNHYKIKK